MMSVKYYNKFIIYDIIRPHCMHAVYKRPIATDVCVSVCLLVTRMCPAKTAEPIEMPFERLSLVGPGNHVLDGRSRFSLREGTIFEGLSGPSKSNGSLLCGV